MINQHMNKLGVRIGLIGLVALGASFWQAPVRAAEPSVAIPPPAVDDALTPAHGSRTVVLAAGCFWGVQAVYQHTAGVTKAVSGYAGGSKADAAYKKVSAGNTGHAESVRVTYDPHVITYGKLLQIYFSVAHNPTELNRQGPDTGTQYRSEIFVHNADQMRVAKAYIIQLDKAKLFSGPIVTKVELGKAFYPAETEHQNYLTLHPGDPYIVANDAPKVQNLKTRFPKLYQDKPILVETASK